MNLAAGLEDSIIQTVKPEWNGGRTSTVIETATEANPPDASTEAQVEAEVAKAIHLTPEPPEEKREPVVETRAALSQPQAASIRDTKDLIAAPHFILTLQQTYHRTGFFNVPVGYDRYFGKDNAPITIYCGREKLAVSGTINRTANTNGTPRIMDAVALKQWFQKRQIMSSLKISIVDPTTIHVHDN